MSIQFQCPGCGKILAVGEENVGKQAKCPHCELVSLVPEMSSDIYDAESVGSDQAAAPEPSQPVSGSPFGVQQPPQPTIYEPINPHLVDAIIITLCCCLPFGIVGIVYAAMCKGQISVGNYELAKDYSKKANMWNMIGLAIGLCMIALNLIFQFIAAQNGMRGM